jgi:diadenylate cyclase
VVESNEDMRRREVLTMLAPGTSMRDGIERILRAHRGALIVIGATPQVLAISSGGFSIDTPSTGQRIAELSKMDGALVVDAEAQRVLRANVQLVPDPSIPTDETGTRHRSAERTARQTGLPVLAVSESLGLVSLYLDGERYVLEEVATVMHRANQAMTTLERYRARLDEVVGSLATRELEDQVTLRDVALALQRAEMLGRIVDEIEGHVVELGSEGRMIALQLEELIAPVASLRELIVRDYLADRRRKPARTLGELSALSTDDLLDHDRIVRLLAYDGGELDRRVTPRGYRMLGRIPRLPMVVVERLIDHFGTLPPILEASAAQLGDVEGVGSTRARAVREGLRRRREQLADAAAQ